MTGPQLEPVKLPVRDINYFFWLSCTKSLRQRKDCSHGRRWAFKQNWVCIWRLLIDRKKSFLCADPLCFVCLCVYAFICKSMCILICICRWMCMYLWLCICVCVCVIWCLPPFPSPISAFRPSFVIQAVSNHLRFFFSLFKDIELSTLLLLFSYNHDLFSAFEHSHFLFSVSGLWI